MGPSLLHGRHSLRGPRRARRHLRRRFYRCCPSAATPPPVLIPVEVYGIATNGTLTLKGLAVDCGDGTPGSRCFVLSADGNRVAIARERFGGPTPEGTRCLTLIPEWPTGRPSGSSRGRRTTPSIFGSALALDDSGDLVANGGQHHDSGALAVHQQARPCVRAREQRDGVELGPARIRPHRNGGRWPAPLPHRTPPLRSLPQPVRSLSPQRRFPRRPKPVHPNVTLGMFDCDLERWSGGGSRRALRRRG